MKKLISLWTKENSVIDQYQSVTSIWECPLETMNITGSQENKISGVWNY